jgi:uncharacterized protein
MAAERPLLAITRKDLENGPKHVRAELPAEWLTARLALTDAETAAAPTVAPVLSAAQAGSVDLRFTPAGVDQFLLQGHVRAIVDVACSRCLDPAHVPVDAEITLLFVPKAPEGARRPKGRTSKDSDGEFEFEGDEADVAQYDGETVVLDDLVREAIVLEMPISPLCSESCAGMASDPKVAEKLEAARIDPRLAPLAELAKKAKGEADSKKK